MSGYSAHEHEIADLIRRAFADASPPEKDEMFAVRFFEDDERECQDLLYARDWEEIPARNICHAPIALSTPKAFRFWLPALMIAQIENEDELAEGNSDAAKALSGLSLPEFPDLSRRLREAQFESLSAAQVDAVKEFLRFFRSVYGEDVINKDFIAACRYWLPREGPGSAP